MTNNNNIKTIPFYFKEEIINALLGRETFEVIECSSDISAAIKWVEEAIENYAGYNSFFYKVLECPANQTLCITYVVNKPKISSQVHGNSTESTNSVAETPSVRRPVISVSRNEELEVADTDTGPLFSPDNEKLKDIAGGDLYALLSVCTNEDLEPLVKSITGKLSNSLELHEDYKRHNPCHTKYYRVIGDEIRLYGGNSFRNMLRGGEGPPYDEIVIDVCKKLDIPFKQGKTVQNESNMLTICLERQWKALSSAEQAEIIAEARKSASKETFKTTTVIKEGGALLLSRALLGPLGWGAMVFSIADPAFKVTVPCVLQIAYLRKKFLDAVATVSSASSNSTEITGNSSALPTMVRTASLTIGNSEDAPVLALAWISEPETRGLYRLNDHIDKISKLTPLFQAVPNLATAGEVATTKYMEVVITGDMMAAKGIPGAFRCMTQGANGIKSHGHLLEPSNLSNIVNASALFQVASVAVAQKHLADIGEKLSEIKTCVDRIHHFQKNERRSTLTGSIRYFEQVAQSVLSGEVSDSIRNQIEQHEVDLLRAQDHLMEDIRHESQEIINVKDNDMFGTKGMQGAIKNHQDILNDLYQQLILCIRARACGWQLLVAFSGEERLKNNRKRNIQDSLDALAESGDLLKQTDIFMRQKIKNMSSFWNMNITVNERKLSLLEWNDKLTTDILSGKEQVVRGIRAAESVMVDRQQPVTMMVEMERDQIVNAYIA